MKKTIIYLIAIVILITGVYIYTRYSILKTKDYKPDNSKSQSALDLRPAIIAKLRQMVKDGSGGLYNLSIGTIEPNIVSSTLDLTNTILSPDSVVANDLDRKKMLTDDVFRISFSALHITGININDLLSKSQLSLNDISINSPIIEVYHKKRIYNKEGRNNDSVTLYKKLMENMNSISIKSIEVMYGTLLINDLAKKNILTKLNDISINMNDIRIDSTTQFDKKRFLYAKSAKLSTQNISGLTQDSLYYYKCGSVDISTNENEMNALHIELHPRENKNAFESHLKERKEMYDLVIPKLTLSDIDWWGMINRETIIAKKAVANNCTLSIYLDRSLPFRKVKFNNFPHQILMRTALPVSISKMFLQHTSLEYKEYNPGMNETGTIYLDDIKSEISNITNIPEFIKKHKLLTIQNSGLFMHKIPMTNSFEFDLSKYRTGNFNMSLNIGEMDTSILNPIAKPLGEFMIKKGIIQKGIAHISGTNTSTTGKGELLYKDLYLIGLKKNKNDPDRIKKKSIVSFFGNLFLIKNSNPSNGKSPRTVDFAFTRESKSTFFSMVWNTIFLGILKTIGLPASFAEKTY